MMYRNFVVSVLLVSAHSQAQRPEPILRPCDRCEQIYVAMPNDLSHQSVVHKSEGAPLQLRGTVHDATGAPIPGAIVYIHHTDAQGVYPGANAAKPHGLLRAWARTDAQGSYRFDTIRPAAYAVQPGQVSEPAHIHMMLIEPGRCSYYIDDVWFSDDPLLSAGHRESAQRNPRGGGGLQTPTLDAAGVWQVQRDIIIGAGIANYSECSGGTN